MLSGGPGGIITPRILIVDDDPNLLVLLADQLRADGYEPITARDGVEALRRLRTSWPDLLIIDMMMPRMDGLSLAREIKSRADLPIIVRARDSQHAAELYRAGASHAVPETLESSLQLSEAVLVDLGVPMGPVIASIHERREAAIEAARAEKEAAEERWLELAEQVEQLQA